MKYTNYVYVLFKISYILVILLQDFNMHSCLRQRGMQKHIYTM